MRVSFSADLKNILFIPEDGKEVLKLEKFPGLLNTDSTYYSVAKPAVVFNLISRLRRKIKNITLSPEVDAFLNGDFKLKPIPASFKFFTKPMEFQEIALRYLYTVGSGGLLLEPGMGKTKVIFDFMRLMEFKKSLIVCPNALKFVWEEELIKHSPGTTCYVIQSTDMVAERKAIIEKEPDMIVINYEKVALLEDLLAKCKFDFIGVDEALIKDPRSIRTKTLTRLGRSIPHKVLMSGTLVNNSPEDIFAPVRFMEPSLIGTGITKFKDEYAILCKTNKNICFGYRNIPEIRSILDSCSIVMTKEEWLHLLPSKKFFHIDCMMSDEQRDIYDLVSSNFVLPTDNGFQMLENPLTVAMKLTQISNGFIYIDEDPVDEEDLGLKDTTKKKAKKKRLVKIFEEQVKANKLIELMVGKLKTRRCLVWFNMSAERTIIEKALTDAGVSFLTIAGGEKNIGGKVREFNNNNSVQILLCQAKSVNYGVTTMGASKEYLEDQDIEVMPGLDTTVYTQIFYSLNYSLEVFLQQQDRIHRIGQTEECEYYILTANSKVDQNIRLTIESKQFLRKEMLIDWVKRD